MSSERINLLLSSVAALLIMISVPGSRCAAEFQDNQMSCTGFSSQPAALSSLNNNTNGLRGTSRA